MSDESTYYYETVYTSLVEGGAGLIALSGNLPSLRASIFGQKYLQGQSYLHSVIRPIQSGETYSDVSEGVYTSLYFGGVGVTAFVQTPDLTATYTISPIPNSGAGDLHALIRPIQLGSGDLGAYWRSSESGSMDLVSTYSGFTYSDLIGYIQPTISGERNLNVEIEPVPGVDLTSEIQGIFREDLYAQLVASEPITLSATLSGQPVLDLYVQYFGYDFSTIDAVYSGYTFSDLTTTITGLTTASSSLSATIQGFLGINITENLSGYLIGTSSGYTTLSATLTGLSILDLSANYFGYTYEDLPTTITGVLFNGALEATINPTGSLLDLIAYITPSVTNNSNLESTIDGTGVADLSGQINSETNTTLSATLTPTGINYFDLFSNILGVTYSDMSATYDYLVGNTLDAIITTIEAPPLYAVIEPKVFYIESSIPINTYPVTSLKAIINANACLPGSDFSNLAVIISGATVQDLSATIVGITGQLALSVDEIPVAIRQKVISQDWAFFIFDQPGYTQNNLQLVFTNSPLRDLRAMIEGVQANADLTSTITANYIPPISRTGVPLGQWVNLKTGETKLLRLFFKGNAVNFYYSDEAVKTYSEHPNDSLEIIVESYKRQSEIDSLLNLKTDVNRCQVNIDGFESMDGAIKYAIACSLSELSGELLATIEPIGFPVDISATVSGIDSNFLRDLPATIVPVANDPDLTATVSSTGSLLDLSSTIFPVTGQVTSTPFFDSYGNRYLPTLLVSPDGEYSVILTPISPSGIIEVVSPDLEVIISGIDTLSLSSTISGL